MIASFTSPFTSYAPASACCDPLNDAEEFAWFLGAAQDVLTRLVANLSETVKQQHHVIESVQVELKEIEIHNTELREEVRSLQEKLDSYFEGHGAAFCEEV